MDGDGSFAATMREALKLVRSGALRDATRTIQAGLAGRQRRAPGEHDAPIEARIVRDAIEDARSSSDSTHGSTGQPGARPVEAPADPFSSLRMPDLPSGWRAPGLPGTSARRAPPAAPLRARLTRPAGADTPRPLLVMLHGCKQDPEDFARGTRMDRAAHERGWFVLYPEQSQRANGMRCWNWFDPAVRKPGAGEDGALLELVDRTIAAGPIDPARVYVAGLSAGAAMAVVLAANHPERFAAVGAHSGLPYGAAANVPDAFAAMRDGGVAPALPPGRLVPLVAIHGDADATVAPRNTERLVGQWLAAGGAATWSLVETDVGDRARLRRWHDPDGRAVLEDWRCAGLGHAWAGGDPAGSYTDPAGPDASTILLDFFERHTLAHG